MKIEKIDSNFQKDEYIQSDNKTAYTIPCDKFDLYGVCYDENLHQFTRMDNSIAQRVSGGVGYLSTHTSGGRLRFSTDSATIGILSRILPFSQCHICRLQAVAVLL